MNTRITTTILAAGFLVGCNSGSGGSSGGSPPTPDPVADVETRLYMVSNFTNLSVDGSFEVTVTQGSDFFVELTVDSAEVEKLDVGVDGNTLRIGFIPGVDVRADTLEAVVEMPSLEGITLAGSNQVDVTGFTTANLNVSLDGNNVLRGHGSVFHFVMATIAGSSMFELVNLTALPAVHIELFGSSSATLNLMDFANLTGTLMGTASLSYYGSNINLQLNSAPSSNVTRLGDSR